MSIWTIQVIDPAKGDAYPEWLKNPDPNAVMLIATSGEHAQAVDLQHPITRERLAAGLLVLSRNLDHYGAADEPTA